jgi:hypothetical protein
LLVLFDAGGNIVGPPSGVEQQILRQLGASKFGRSIGSMAMPFGLFNRVAPSTDYRVSGSVLSSNFNSLFIYGFGVLGCSSATMFVATYSWTLRRSYWPLTI